MNYFPLIFDNYSFQSKSLLYISYLFLYVVNFLSWSLLQDVYIFSARLIT